MRSYKEVKLYVGFFAGLIFGFAFPLIFVILDLKELGEELTYENALFVIQSQGIYSFSMLAFPLIFGVVFLSILLVLNSKKELEKANKQVLIEQRRSLINSKMASIGEMASGIAHEINNPLAFINLTAKTFEKQIKKNNNTPKLEDAREFIETTYSSVRRVSNIIDTMKKLTSSSSISTHEKVDIVEIVKEAVQSQEARAKESSVNLSTSVESAYCVCCKDDIVKAVENLVINSIQELSLKKYLGANKWVEVRSEIREDKVRILVRDSGDTIALDVVENMFDPFYSTKDVNSGTGLGLSLTKNIVSFSNGDLFYNEEAVATEFVIELYLG